MGSQPQRTAAIAAAGVSQFSRGTDKSVLELGREACENALADAGLPVSEIDGVLTYSLYNDAPSAEAIGAVLGVEDLSYVMDFAQGGQSPCFMVGHAAAAIAGGLATSVLVVRTLRGRSGVRIGSERAVGGATPFRYPLGYTAYPQYVATMARRYMIETDADEEDLAAIAMIQREYATKNERAILRSPLSRDDYFASPYVAEPFRVVDCTIEVDGAAAVLVTSLDRARTLRRLPATVQGVAWASHGFDLDMGSMLSLPDYSRNFTSHLADRLWSSAGLGPGDVDVAEIYDCFTAVVLQSLEGLGFCERGGAGEFVRAGETRLDGALPTNTHGGLLAEGYIHGMNSVTEAVWQLQGRCGERQVHDAEVAAVSSGGMHAGSALVLVRDR
jgi:acetyl-CoA acetyltransferase